MSSHSADDDGGHCTPLTPGNSGRPSPQIQHVPRREGEELRVALQFYACTCEPGNCETGCVDDVSCGATARRALSLPQPGGWRPSREEIAKAICHEEWMGTQPWDRKPQSFRDRYLAYADAVLALPPVPTDGGEQDNTVSSSSLPAHVAEEATATEALRSAGSDD